MAVPEAYATTGQLATYWKGLTAGETARAGDLLKRAATLINEIPGAVADGEPAFSSAACEHVSLDMVKRAMLSRGDGVIEHTAEMADMSGTDKYVNPAGSLYITEREVDRLLGTLGAPSVQAFSVALSSNVRVPGQPWNNQPSSQTD